MIGRFPSLTWDWVACTLNPYFEGNNVDAMVEDDAFINETPQHWFFGRDNSGDMRLPHNIAATWERAEKMGPVLLVTADGSIDCSGSPNDQEDVTAQLHFCEAVAAVGALSVGGAFVLKVCVRVVYLQLVCMSMRCVRGCEDVRMECWMTHTHAHTDVHSL